jgi:hypothetical protein
MDASDDDLAGVDFAALNAKALNATQGPGHFTPLSLSQLSNL